MDLKKVLVTGSQGYIGSNLCQFLSNHGFLVIDYDIKEGLDILNFESLRYHFSGCDYVYHCAAIAGVQQCEEDRVKAYQVNVVGTHNVMFLAQELGVMPILFSSQAVFGTSFYGKTKKMVEHAFRDRAIILRLSNVFGGSHFNEKSTVINHFKQDDPLIVKTRDTRDFIHMDHVMETCLRAQTFAFGIHDVTSHCDLPIPLLAQLISTIRDVPIHYEVTEHVNPYSEDTSGD